MSRVAHPAGPRHGDVLPADHPPAAPEDLNALCPGIWPRGARRSGGVLRLGGVDVRDLAAELGTPVYVCDEEDVRSRCREYTEAFGPDGRVFYAAKAFCSRAVLRWVSSEGLGVDVCTGGELEVALSAGVPPEQITLHGNNKLIDELSRAVAVGVGHIVVDSFEEIARLAYLTDPAPGGRPPGPPRDTITRPSVLVRVTTGVEAHTHEFMATAHDDQKFGFSLASGAADEAVRRVIAAPGLSFAGLHSHIGSQIFDTAGFEVAAHRVVGLAVRIRDEHGVEIAELDLGGGFGIAYTEEDDAPEVKDLAQSLREIVDGQCRAAGLARPRLTVEPGRGIVGPSTVSLYTVGTIKDVDGLRTYVSVDGGMSDNIRTALYDASYACALASRASAAAPMLSRVVGRHCESGDIVVRHAWLPAEQADDLALRVGARLELAGIAVRRVGHRRADAIDRSLLTADPYALATRPDVDIVVEVIGGIEPARSLMLAALKGGKPVVTANKALLAENGAEIYGAAREYGADLYYEASVAGAIPLLRPLRESLAGDTVHRVLGIVNGTTNFILDRMDSSGAGFSESLEEAQALGYAEADPTADVEGFDAAAKAAILASLAFHTPVTAADVHREGITEVTATDILSARALGRVVRSEEHTSELQSQFHLVCR